MQFFFITLCLNVCSRSSKQYLGLSHVLTFFTSLLASSIYALHSRLCRMPTITCCFIKSTAQPIIQLLYYKTDSNGAYIALVLDNIICNGAPSSPLWSLSGLVACRMSQHIIQYVRCSVHWIINEHHFYHFVWVLFLQMPFYVHRMNINSSLHHCTTAPLLGIAASTVKSKWDIVFVTVLLLAVRR